MATLIRTNGTREEVTPQNGKYFTLPELQGFVGGYIEVVMGLADGRHMYLNEEGKLHGLPVNMEATRVSGLYPHDIIVGDVVLVADSEEEEAHEGAE